MTRLVVDGRTIEPSPEYRAAQARMDAAQRDALRVLAAEMRSVASKPPTVWQRLRRAVGLR